MGAFLQYVDKYYPLPDRELIYVPELCVIANENFWITTMKPKLDQIGVKAIGYQSALDLVKSSKENFEKMNFQKINGL